MRLKRMVIEEGVMDWEVLSATFRVEIKEVQMRWRKILFELLRVNMSTHSDNLLWTKLEDRIIVNGEKQAGEWGSEKSLFLPHRTVGSIRTRKRRTMLERIDRVSKVLAVEECLHKISMRYRAEADLKIPEQ